MKTLFTLAAAGPCAPLIASATALEGATEEAAVGVAADQIRSSIGKCPDASIRAAATTTLARSEQLVDLGPVASNSAVTVTITRPKDAPAKTWTRTAFE
jgi:hypothetical protein